MGGDTLSRRRLLALAAATVTAGCGGQNDSGDADGRFRNDGGPPSRTTTRTATRTDDGGSVDLDIDTPTETEPRSREDRTTDRSEETPERTRTATGADRLEQAREALNASITAYTDVDGVTSVLDVDASVTAFDETAVRDELASATTHLDRAAESSEVDDGTVERLRTARDTIDELVACQMPVVDAYRTFDRATTALFDEEFETVENALSDLDLNRSTAATALQSLERNTDASDLEPVDGITEREYEVKLDQFADEIEVFEDIQGPVDRYNDGLETFADSVDSYVGKAYPDAQRTLLESLNGFEIAATQLMSVTTPRSLNDDVGRLQRTAEVLAAGTDHLTESAQAAKNGQEQEQQSDFNDAVEEYQRSGTVNDLDSYTQLIEES